MTETAKILDAAWKALGLTSDNQLANAIDWQRATISNYRTGKRQMDVEQCAEFAVKTKIPLEAVVWASVADRRSKKSTKSDTQSTLFLSLQP